MAVNPYEKAGDDFKFLLTMHRALALVFAVWGPGAHLRIPVGSMGKAPGRGPGAEPPEALRF